jgi:hypothetical protein
MSEQFPAIIAPRMPTPRQAQRVRKQMIQRYMVAYNMAIAKKHFELARVYQKAYVGVANLVKNSKLSGAQKDARMLKINNLVENAELYYAPEAVAKITELTGGQV